MDARDEKTRLVSEAQTQVRTRRGSMREVWPIGALVDGRYTVEDVRGGPGISGMGVVYILNDGQRRVAAKTFQRQFAGDLDLILRFLREAKTWMLTGFHPHIVQAYAIDIIEATPYLFMEYVDAGERGVSLADWIRNEPLPAETVLRFALAACDAMVHATAAVPGLVHRDLKPENILIGRDGALKITDFGLVRCNLLDAPLFAAGPGSAGKSIDDLTTVGAVMGTPAYMAPEQFLDPDSVDMKADIYAFGCCFYEALCGHRVFQVQGFTPHGHIEQMRLYHLEASPVPLRLRGAHVPPALDAVVMRCLRKDKAERWRDFHELRDALAEAAAPLIGTPPPPAGERIPKAEEVAAQVRSLNLLDGYDRAVRHQSLRDSVSQGPYAFHLALASYFHVQADEPEEERQLMSALRTAPHGGGTEAGRRLAALYIAEGDASKAEALIDRMVLERPERWDELAELQCAVYLARNAYAEAEALVERMGDTFRAALLRGAILKQAGRTAEYAAFLETFVQRALVHAEGLLAQVRPGLPVGWDQAGDAAAFRAAVEALGASLDTAPLDGAEEALWPRLDAYPDFAMVTAYLSAYCGKLAALDGVRSEEARAPYAAAAALLGHPARIERFLRRDEDWIWTR